MQLHRIMPRLLLALAILPALSLSPAAAQEADEPIWSTSWAMSPSSLPPDPDAENAFDNQTLRQIVHTSAGGDSLRIRLSNAHGSGPLDVGAVSVALQDEDSRIVPDTLETVTFSQRERFTIPHGAVAVSDPLEFDVPRLGNLSVSIYLPGPSGAATLHRAARQTNYVSGRGDHTQSTEIPQAEEVTVWHYLTAIDVERSERIGGMMTTGRTEDGSTGLVNLRPEDRIRTIVTVGDSITDGVGSSLDSNSRWPDVLARRLLAEPGTEGLSVANAGLSGNRVLHENDPRFGENLQSRFERDVLALPGVSHIVLLEGINDIGMGAMNPGQEVSAEEIIAGYRQIIARAHARDIKVIGATLTPFEGAGYYTEEGEAKRRRVNEWIRNSAEFDGVIDFASVVMDPDNPRRIRPGFTEDNLHPNDAGYRAMGESIELELFHP